MKTWKVKDSELNGSPFPLELKLLLHFFVNLITVLILEVVTAVTMNNTNFRGVAACGLVEV
jgi:hypothetical protein